jgi:uncharacterized membrane protein YidH (DUF202 family)
VKKILISVGSFLSFSLPTLALAQNLDQYPGNLVVQATSVLRILVTFLISLAVVWFIWNVIRYVMSQDEEGKGKAKSQMIWGIVAIAVMVSVWGVVEGNNQIPSSVQTMIPPII